MKIAVVIPNWNGADLIVECLESLQKQTQKHEIIVVDNGSVDQSVYIIEEQFPEVTLIKLHKNTGFTGGVNMGIQFAIDQGYDAVALFNNDAVADKDWLNNLATQMQTRKDIGIVTGKLMRDDRIYIDSTGDYYSTWGIPFPRGRNVKDEGQFEQVKSVFGASGGASLYRIKTLKEIGLFDQRFFAYYEDVDISLRARLAGWDIVYTPDAVAYHSVGATSSGLGDFTRYHSIKNFLMLYTKDMPFRLYWKYLPTFLYQFARTTARSIIDFKLHVWAKAVLYFLFKLPSILIDRWDIQSGRRLSVQEVDELLYRARPPKIPTIHKK